MVLSFPARDRTGFAALSLFLLLLFVLPIVASQFPHTIADLAGIFFQAGALVFGGGHVVLPLLRDALVPGGWISDDRFLTGYGLAQAIPGPLFTLAAYLGAANAYTSSPALGSLVASVFIFVPGLLIAVAGVSLWGRPQRTRTCVQLLPASMPRWLEFLVPRSMTPYGRVRYTTAPMRPSQSPAWSYWNVLGLHPSWCF